VRVHDQRGFNLIEVLVALVVLSIGLLGIAGLQLSTIRNTQSSLSRSLATTFMNDLAEKIYANTPGALNYGALDSNAANYCATVLTICAREGTSGAVPAACTSAQMAAYDFFASACGLPNGTTRAGGVVDQLTAGRIQTTCNPAPCAAGSLINITVSWQDRGSSGSVDATQQASLNTQTLTMVVQP
jgi:type IV pilus assembly protein PilV